MFLERLENWISLPLKTLVIFFFFFNVVSCLLFISCPTSREAEEILRLAIKFIELSWISETHGFVRVVGSVVSEIKILKNKRIYKSPFLTDSILVSLRTKSGGRRRVLCLCGFFA